MNAERNLVKNQQIYNKESFCYVINIIAEHDDWIKGWLKQLKRGNYMDFVDNALYLGQLVGQAGNLSWPSRANKLTTDN